ncbi:nucleosome assembly protein 1-like 1 isoform X2 [Drosophila santomea]|uniref:nucleosome assembly protein 1-like 1 isoform X2 n=1 Tax=Drosophila santomea TaxID=129105 RepID=UPI001952EBE8|nr:nucleosome assembly protein 1-like 1 isoform X2 [Drosophila santomea]
METVRNRNPPRVKYTAPPKPEESTFTENEKKTITDLKQLYLETINLDVALQRDIYNMEKKYEDKHNIIFDKRKKILDEFRKQNHGDTESSQSVPNFWLKVLKASYTEFISKKDEKILECLSDIRSRLYNDPVVKFDIQFHFDPNDHFTNTVLTKTYFLNCLPDPEDPLAYDGAEIYKCEGCVINWKPSKDQAKNENHLEEPSFFDFFSPPLLPDDTEDANYCDVNAILQNDFELGFYLKERVIPKAVIFFTGEIADCQSSSGSETESEDTEDELDGEEESSYGNDK